MRWCRICSLTLLFLLLTSHSIHAYERDVHYDLTKYLARWAGFSEGEAEQIAAADQEIDAKPEFNPLPNPNFCPELREIAGPASALVAIPVACKNDPEFQRMVTAQRTYHFVDSERLRALRESAFQGRNLKTLGHYLHALQDTFAHSLMDYADLPPLDKLVASLGRLPDEKILGHFLYGHSLDKTYERPDLAEQMARHVYAELARFKGSVNRWNELEATVARFVREKDAQKQLKYLAALSVPESAQALSKSEGSTEPVGLAVKQSTDRPAAPHSEPSKTPPQELTAQSTLPTGYPKGIDEETQVEFAFGDNKCLERPYQLPPAMLSGSVLVIAKLPNTFTDLSRLDEELVKRILDKGRDFALAQCPRIESVRHRTVIGIDVLLFESSAKTHDQENALVRGSYSSEVKDFQSLFFYADSRLKELRPAQSQEIEQVIATIIQEGTSSNPFGSIRIGKTPDEVARQYIEAFKARDIITLVAMNHNGALDSIARIKRDYFAASWEHHLKKWAEGVVKSFLTLFDETPKKVVSEWRCFEFSQMRLHGRTCWDPPEFVAVESLTYEIKILDIRREEARPKDVTVVPVEVRYPLGSLVRDKHRYEMRPGAKDVAIIKDAEVEIFVDEAPSTRVIGFRVGRVGEER